MLYPFLKLLAYLISIASGELHADRGRTSNFSPALVATQEAKRGKEKKARCQVALPVQALLRQSYKAVVTKS